MPNYHSMNRNDLILEKEKLQKEYDSFKAKNLSLNMSRGKPNPAQFEISNELFNVKSFISRDGIDCRNYGVLDGIPEAKELFAELLDAPVENVFVGGNSSLNLMYDAFARAMTHGMFNSDKPWCKYDEIKFLCVTPGYDRHFAICEHFGIKMLNVPMQSDGPDMDLVEELVRDEAVKGIWCVPKYSNPQGITYSDEKVKRLAKLKPAAKDFRIFWDNAYAVHDFDINDCDKLLPIFPECKKNNNEDIVFMFTSSSKITFSGGGVAAMAMSDNNLSYTKKLMSAQTIGADKLNQLRHAQLLKNKAGVIEHMKGHSKIIRPKFDIVLDCLEKSIKPYGVGSWHTPKGGYFVSFEANGGSAKRIVELCSECGVTLTPAGAAFPYHNDPNDSNIRIAPTFPSCEDLKLAMEIFAICARLSAIENLIK